MSKFCLMHLLILAVIVITGFQNSFAGELIQTDVPAMVPIDLDSYLMWDRLAYHRIGIRGYMRSTYDRQGNNRGADASHYLYRPEKTFNVALDVKGCGVLYFKRTNHWHGSPWHYEVDGEDMIVKETSTADPEGAKGDTKKPLVNPPSMAEFEFEAKKDVPYAILVRGKNVEGNLFSDATWIQFDDDIATTVMDSEYGHEMGFGNWADKYEAGVYAWSSAMPSGKAKTITFKKSGKHRMRIQPRHDVHVIDQIWLSTTQRTVPDFKHPVEMKTDIDNIVLNVADAKNLKGNVVIIEDEGAYKGKAFQMSHAELPPCVFIPEHLFPNPLTWTWSITKGADLMWVPLAFEERMRIAYGRTYYGTGYYIYHLMTNGMNNLSRNLEAWNRQSPDPKVLELLNKSGTDIAPKGVWVKKYSETIKVKPFEWTMIEEITDAPASIRALKFTVSREDAYEFGKSRLRITWDDRWHASVDAPVALFFGVGHLYNNNDREYLVKGFPINVRYDEKNVYLSCYYPMPFFKNAKIEIQGRGGKTFENVKYEIRTTAFEDPINTVGYFHATYSDHPKPELGCDVTFLDTTQVEGGGDWSGSFVGMSWIFSHDGVLWTLEGDPRFIFDDSRTPQGWGTGTEEWGGGGDYWGGRNMTLPFAGHPVGSKKDTAKNKKDLLNSAYRFLIADIFPFGKNAKISLEHGGENNSQQHYEGVVYWYGIDSPALVRTDMINVCDEKSIEEHNYVSPTASKPYDLVSRYELGKDTGKDSEMFFAAEQDKVRVMKGTSKFEVKLNKDNLGVMLRRKFDYIYPNQTAKVSVRAAGSDGPWYEAGIWYTAGSNTCYFSWAKGELGEPGYTVITSNRRWREEEFLISPELTKGISKLEIKVEWVADDKKLTPKTAYPVESVWSASRYWVYCYKMPKVVLPDKNSL